MRKALLVLLIAITSFHVYSQVGIKGYNIGDVAPNGGGYGNPIKTTVGGIEGTLIIDITKDKKQIYNIAFSMKTPYDGFSYGVSKYIALQFVEDISNHFGIELEKGDLSYRTIELGPGIFREYTGTIPDEKHDIRIMVGIEDVRYKEKSERTKKDYGHYLYFEIWGNGMYNEYFKRERERKKSDF